MDQDEIKEEQLETTTEEDKTEEAKQEIPAELEGLSEEVAQEALKEAQAAQEPKEEDGATEEETEEDGESAEPNSDNKSSIEPILDRPKQKIPYERFKKEVDEKKNLKAELDSLKAELAAMRENNNKAVPPQQVMTQQAPARPVQGAGGFRFTPEVTQAIKQAIQEQAMQMSGLSKEDVDNLDYMDDDDQRKQQWHYANKAAEAKVMGAIQQAQYERAMRAKQFMDQHQRSVDAYNAFVTAEKEEPDFEAVKQYAGTTYFQSLPPDEKPVINDAYTRIDKNIASPADIALIKRFYQDAKASYYSNNKQAAKTNNAAVNKIKQASAHPRAESVEGSAAKTGKPSVATLERMLNEKNWDDIPKEYQDLLLGM